MKRFEKAKEQKGRFLGMLLDKLVATLVGNLLIVKDTIRAGESTTTAGEGTISAGQDF